MSTRHHDEARIGPTRQHHDPTGRAPAVHLQAIAAVAATVPLADSIRTPAGEWLALEDAVEAVTGIECAGFMRSERLGGFWASRILESRELPITAIADADHIDRIAGRLLIAVVTDPWADGEPRARVLTRAVHNSAPGFEIREMVLLTDSGASTTSPEAHGLTTW